MSIPVNGQRQNPMISPEEALTIALDYFERNNIRYSMGGSVHVEDLHSNHTVIYGNDEDAWIVRYPNPHVSGLALCSSYAILISKATGQVIFNGDVHDEG